MTDPMCTAGRSPVSDGLATLALLLHAAALLASTVCLGAFLIGQASVAVTAGPLAVLHLAGARAVLLLDSRREKGGPARGESVVPLGGYALAGSSL